MKYIPLVILLIESILSFYKYLVPKAFFDRDIFDVLKGIIFVVLAFVIYKNINKRSIQWTVIILSLLLGPGGFLGFGAIIAIVLAISFMLLPKTSVSK